MQQRQLQNVRLPPINTHTHTQRPFCFCLILTKNTRIIMQTTMIDTKFDGI